ncbi:hypothetical protein [Sandaracinus amylolyticus]|uniref:Lipoprotein n=1 Tax=Sandaracinus amylolyticus TaxID=927083 RepID=A0A0F6YJ73_9BACT|nr:hypothetical protein [Sandaracinus amylolyticus]AKF07688.1 hypothetical protein DB32_004837 [Sandaracinus amylolyticus]
MTSRFVRSLLVALALTAPTLQGCAASHSTESLEVEASIASVTLAEDCPDAQPAAPREPGLIGDCAEDGPCGWCTQSSVQLAIRAGEGDAAVPFEVVSIRLRTLDGELVDELEPRGAQVFLGETFGAWDERIEPGAELDVRYDTSAPDWSAIGSGEAYRSYGVQLRIEMRVRIDGVERTLELAPVSREPEIVT